MIDFSTDQPLQDAVDRLGNKTPIGSMMSSAEWEMAPLELRDRSFWIARVQEERILAEAQRRILQAIRKQRDGSGRLMDRGRFILEMQDVLRQLGYEPDPDQKGSLQDVSSMRRLGLIWEMNLAMANGYASWKSQMTSALLLMNPAWELVRGFPRIERRMWPQIWLEHGGKFYPPAGPAYPDAPGRMIALKTDPIWRKISRFGVPWYPLDWGSGMIMKSMRRRDALKLIATDGSRLLKEDDAPQQPVQIPFNAGLEASVKGVPEPGLERLRSDFGDAIRFDGERVTYERDLSPGNEHRKETVREELRIRARDTFERGEAESASVPDGKSVLVAGAAVEVGRKQFLHEFSETSSGAVADLLRGSLSDRVRVEEIDGNVIAWRPDLLPLSARDLMALTEADLHGALLGHGSSRGPTVEVVIRNAEGDAVFVFRAPANGAKAFANARLRDWEDATGESFTVDMGGGAR